MGQGGQQYGAGVGQGQQYGAGPLMVSQGGQQFGGAVGQGQPGLNQGRFLNNLGGGGYQNTIAGGFNAGNRGFGQGFGNGGYNAQNLGFGQNQFG